MSVYFLGRPGELLNEFDLIDVKFVNDVEGELVSLFSSLSIITDKEDDDMKRLRFRQRKRSFLFFSFFFKQTHIQIQTHKPEQKNLVFKKKSNDNVFMNP